MKSLIAVWCAIVELQLIAGDVHVYVKEVGYRISMLNAETSGGQPTPRDCINFCYSQADIRDSLKSFDYKLRTGTCNCQIVDKFTNPEAFEPAAFMDEYTIIHQDVSATYTIPAPVIHSRQSDCGYLCLATPGCNAFIRSVNGVNFDCTLINNIE